MEKLCLWKNLRKRLVNTKTVQRNPETMCHFWQREEWFSLLQYTYFGGVDPAKLPVGKQKTSGSPEIKGKPEVLTVLSRLYKAKREILSNLSFGARGGSRTRTPLRAPAPEAGESTNSTTRASGVRRVVQRNMYIIT